jgi:hypothetical protein
MSELKVNKVSPRTGTYVSLNTVGMKNIVINGDMSLAQRSTSVASITTGGYKTLDRFEMAMDSVGTWTMSQSTDTPTGQGFANSLKLDCTTADAAPAAGDYLIIIQKFEGQNLQYLKKGTASALSLTASFWVKSTKTGTFICEIFDNDNSRQISASYTVNVTNTWEFKTITFPGDTTGTLNNDNGTSLTLRFWLVAGSTYSSGTLATSWASNVNANAAVGQVNIADSTSNDWYITGVQLEAGTTASDFEFLPVDVNLARCQRYYYGHAIGSDTYKPIGGVSYYSSSTVIGFLQFPSTMRTIPSLVSTSGTDYYRIDRNSGQDYLNSLTIVNTSENMTGVVNTTEASGTAGDSGWLYTNDASATVAFNSEL